LSFYLLILKGIAEKAKENTFIFGNLRVKDSSSPKANEAPKYSREHELQEDRPSRAQKESIKRLFNQDMITNGKRNIYSDPR